MPRALELRIAKRRRRADLKRNSRAIESEKSRASKEQAAEPFYRHVDDAAARLLRALFLCGAAFTGFVYFCYSVYLVASGKAHDWIATVQGMFIILPGSFVAFCWFWVVLSGAVNALILSKKYPTPEANLPPRSIFRLFSEDQPWWALGAIILSIVVCFMSAAIWGVKAVIELFAALLEGSI